MMKDYALPIFILSFICLVVSGALAAVNDKTYPIIESAAEERAYETRKKIIPQAESFEELPYIEGLPTLDRPHRYKKTHAYINSAYEASDNEGYIFTATSKGYGGDIRIMIGITSDGKIIKSEVLAHSETQGLGTIVFEKKAPEYDYNDQNAVAEIDAIAGSTITSDAYRVAIECAFVAFSVIKEAQ